MSSNNPLSDAVEGVTKGLLEWSKENVSAFIQKLKNKKLAFIEESKTIEIVREQYNSGERKFYKEYIENKQFLFLIGLGLTLKKLESEKQKERLQNLREKILKKYGINGLHISEFVQNGILNRYIGILIDELSYAENPITQLKKDIEDTLQNIEKHIIFVQAYMKVSDIIKKSSIIVASNSPRIFIVSGVRPNAKLIQDSIEPLKNLLKEYSLERFSNGEKEILFFKRKLT